MKLQTLLGNRILVRPIDEVKKKAGVIHLPETGMTSTESSYITAEVLQLGMSVLTQNDNRKYIEVGATVLLMKSGALRLEDGTRIVSAEDVIAVL